MTIHGEYYSIFEIILDTGLCTLAWSLTFFVVTITITLMKFITSKRR